MLNDNGNVHLSVTGSISNMRILPEKLETKALSIINI